MRKYIVLFFSVLLLLFACSRGTGGIIKPGVMTNLLIDIHIADGAMINIPQIPDSVYKYGMGTYLQIFKKYHTDSAQFRKSYKYYTLHPEVMTKIYDDVLKRLTVKSDSITALIAKNNKAQAKKGNPGTPVGGKFVPGRGPSQPVQPVRPPLPAKSGVPAGALTPKQQIMRRIRMHRDSLTKKMIKRNPHAIPVK